MDRSSESPRAFHRDTAVTWAVSISAGTVLWMLFLAWPHVEFNYVPFLLWGMVVAFGLAAILKAHPVRIGLGILAGSMVLAPWTAARDLEGFGLTLHMKLLLPASSLLFALTALGGRSARRLINREAASLGSARMLGVAGLAITIAIFTVALKWPRHYPTIEVAIKRIELPGFVVTNQARIGQIRDFRTIGVQRILRTELPEADACEALRQGLIASGVRNARADIHDLLPPERRPSCSLLGTLRGGPTGNLAVQSRSGAQPGSYSVRLTVVEESENLEE